MNGPVMQTAGFDNTEGAMEVNYPKAYEAADTRAAVIKVALQQNPTRKQVRTGNWFVGTDGCLLADVYDHPIWKKLRDHRTTELVFLNRDLKVAVSNNNIYLLDGVERKSIQ